jgi:hypothetical protein
MAEVLLAHSVAFAKCRPLELAGADLGDIMSQLVAHGLL